MVYIIDPQSAGISGNMIIGALVDLGADEDKVKNLMEDVAFDFGEVEVSLSKVDKAGIDATFCNVKTLNEEHENNHHIHFSDFIEKIDLLKFGEIENLTDEMVEMAKSVFKIRTRLLAFLLLLGEELLKLLMAESLFQLLHL